MALIFTSIQTAGIAQLSYLVGDDEAGIAAVFDPRPDVDCYLQLAREKQLAITHIFETHIHVDFVSGARELQARLGSAKIYLSHEGGARYGFDHEGIGDGDVFKLGSALITARHTPGHSPEHLAYLLAEKESVGQMTVHEVKAAGDKLQLLDVRAPAEWQDGHIPKARHIFLGELREHLGKLDQDQPTAIYCNSGYRASIATSILQQQGFARVHNIPGSWQAWQNAGYPVAKGPAAKAPIAKEKE